MKCLLKLMMITTIGMAVSVPAATAVLAAPVQLASVEGQIDHDNLLGLPAMTDLGVKVGHVADVTGGNGEDDFSLIIDTSSSGKPGLDGSLEFDFDVIEVREYHIRVGVADGEAVGP